MIWHEHFWQGQGQDQFLNANLADLLWLAQTQSSVIAPTSKQHLACTNPVVYFIWPDLNPSFNTQAIDVGLASVSPEQDRESRVQQEREKL